MVGMDGIYFVIADADRARFVRPGPDGSLHTVARVDLDTVRERGGEPATPQPPARFTALLAERLNEDFAVDLFVELVLVAEPDVLGELTGLLDAPTGASLIGSLAKNLMDVPDLELWPHLRSWVHPDDGG
jgi:hypothetical protein